MLGSMAQSLDRGLRILDEIAVGRTTLGEIADSLGVHKTTVLRLLATLQEHHLVYREDANHYRLGGRLFDLAAFALDSRQVVSQARGPMRRLAQSTGYGVYLATLEGGGAMVVEVAAGRGLLQTGLRVGVALPLHATASGKVLLSGLSVRKRVEVLVGYEFLAMTERTLGTRADLEAAVERATAQGFSLEVGEHELYVNAAAAPVRDSTGGVVAALAVTVPGVYSEEGGLTRCIPALLAGAAEISHDLGCG